MLKRGPLYMSTGIIYIYRFNQLLKWLVFLKKNEVLVPNVLVTKAVKSTSCSGRPVDQSNSLRIGSSRQDVQTPLPPAQRKRTCCSLRSETENVCCKVRAWMVLLSSKMVSAWYLNNVRTSSVPHLNLLAVNVNHVDSVPVSHPQAATFCEAAANGLQWVCSKWHHWVWLQIPATC